MKLRKTIIGELAIISIDEEIGPEKIKELKTIIQTLLLDNTLKIVINLECVGSMDSTGVGVIVYVLKRIRRAGGDLKLCAPTGDVRKTFQLLKLDRIIDIFDEYHPCPGQLHPASKPRARGSSHPIIPNGIEAPVFVLYSRSP